MSDVMLERFTKWAADRGDLRAAVVFSLCYCWFYYDGADRVLDAEWQYASD